MNRIMEKYLYEGFDKKKLDEHIEKQKKSPLYFQNSFTETIKMEAWDEILKWHEEGKDIKEFVKMKKNNFMMD